MKRLAFALLLLALTASAFADETVRGYTRKDGTYVAPYHRTEPNQNRYDNYSSQGNINPYTGRQGTQPNEFSNPPVYNRSNPNSGFNSNSDSLSPYAAPRQNSQRKSPSF